MKPDRRWMKSVLAESAKAGPILPWQRGTRQIAARKRKSQSDTGPSARG